MINKRELNPNFVFFAIATFAIRGGGGWAVCGFGPALSRRTRVPAVSLRSLNFKPILAPHSVINEVCRSRQSRAIQTGRIVPAARHSNLHAKLNLCRREDD